MEGSPDYGQLCKNNPKKSSLKLPAIGPRDVVIGGKTKSSPLSTARPSLGILKTAGATADIASLEQLIKLHLYAIPICHHGRFGDL